MPKSKRNKLGRLLKTQYQPLTSKPSVVQLTSCAVTLSKVKKHGRERKESLIGNLRSWVDQ